MDALMKQQIETCNRMRQRILSPVLFVRGLVRIPIDAKLKKNLYRERARLLHLAGSAWVLFRAEPVGRDRNFFYFQKSEARHTSVIGDK